MKKWLMTLFILLLCGHPIAVLADQQNPQSVAALIALGLKTNLGLQIELVEVAKGREGVEIEKSVFDSTVFASTEYERFSHPYESGFTPLSKNKGEKLSGQAGISKRFSTGLMTSLALSSEWGTDNDLSNNLDPRYRTALLLDLTQPLLRNLGSSVNTTRVEISRNQQRQVSLGYLLEAQNLILQLESAARQLAAKTEIIQSRQEALTLADELYQANQKRFAAGFIPVSEVQEAETAQVARQLSLTLAVQERDLLQQELNRQLNHNLAQEFDPATLVSSDLEQKTAEIPDIDQLLKTACQKRLELKINNYAVQNSSLQQDYLHNQLKPQLDLKFQAGINGLSGHERSSAAASRYSGNWPDSFGSMSEVDGYQWRTSLEFSMPIGNRSAKSRYRQAVLQLKQDRYRHKDIEAVIKNDLARQRVNMIHAKEQLEITKKFESLAKQSLQQEQRRLDEGLSDTFRMIFFQQKMIDAKIDRINAITRYHLAHAQMEFATGQIFERHNIVLTNNVEELSLENI